MPMSKKKLKFPKQLLRQINECSNGGFILFCLNEKGMPEVMSNFDNLTNAMALNFYLTNWSKAIEAYNIEKTIQMIDADEDPLGEGDGSETPEE